MKKRIFIAIHYMEIGGVERSLLGLLNAIDTNLYDVDLFIYQHRGEFMSLLPPSIHLLRENKRYASIESPMTSVLRKGYLDIILARLWARYACKRYMKKNRLTEGSSIAQLIADATTPLLPSLYGYGEYDLAISFLNPHNIVLQKVKAKKKVAWMHTDYSFIQIEAERELKVWGKYDYIAAISKDVKENFLKKFPTLREKTMLIENILSPKFIREQAKLLDASAEMQADEGVVKLCTVGRFCQAKNIENIPPICQQLLSRQIPVKWFIIGYGSNEAAVRESIRKYKMEEHVILLGKKENPYPYIDACDIYVQPSRYEGKAVTVREAQILQKPVVITNFPTSKSQLDDGKDGIIVPLENSQAAEGIAAFIRNTALQQEIKKQLASRDYGNEAEIEKIYRLI